MEDFVTEGAREHNLADEKLIELYSKIQLLVYGNEKKYNYECSGSGIGENMIDFTIIVAAGKLVPKEIGSLFFEKIDCDFKVSCKKVADDIYPEHEDAYSFRVGLYKKED